MYVVTRGSVLKLFNKDLKARFIHYHHLKPNFIAHCLSICQLPATAFISNHISAEINSREPAAIINSLLLIINPLGVMKYSVSSADVKCRFLRESRKLNYIFLFTPLVIRLERTAERRQNAH